MNASLKPDCQLRLKTKPPGIEYEQRSRSGPVARDGFLLEAAIAPLKSQSVTPLHLYKPTLVFAKLGTHLFHRLLENFCIQDVVLEEGGL